MHDGDIVRDFGSAREHGKTGDVFSRYFQERIGIRRNAKMRRCDFRGVSVMKLNMCCVRPKSTWHAAHHDPQGLRSPRRVAAAAAAGRSPSHRSAAAPPLPLVLDARGRHPQRRQQRARLAPEGQRCRPQAAAAPPCRGCRRCEHCRPLLSPPARIHRRHWRPSGAATSVGAGAVAWLSGA
jgi:hypothetical protein